MICLTLVSFSSADGASVAEGLRQPRINRDSHAFSLGLYSEGRSPLSRDVASSSSGFCSSSLEACAGRVISAEDSVICLAAALARPFVLLSVLCCLISSVEAEIWREHKLRSAEASKQDEAKYSTSTLSHSSVW